MKQPKQKVTKADLQRKLMEATAAQAWVYGKAVREIEKASTKHMVASGVVITITALGGREIITPVLMRDGLSDETISAIQRDLVRSYALATLNAPHLPDDGKEPQE